MCYLEAWEDDDDGHQTALEEDEESSHYTEEALATEDTSAQRRKTTAEAIAAGYGILAGGATKKASVEAIMANNLKKRKDGRVLEVDTDNQPLFGFGNSSQDKCLSAAKMKIVANQKDGVLTVHTLDKGAGPMLLSIETLRALKAVIDFSEEQIQHGSFSSSDRREDTSSCHSQTTCTKTQSDAPQRCRV